MASYSDGIGTAPLAALGSADRKKQTLNIGKETYTVIGFDATGKPFSIVFPAGRPEGRSPGDRFIRL
jgi:hypothetical protein